jgi:hypothetical protein
MVPVENKNHPGHENEKEKTFQVEKKFFWKVDQVYHKRPLNYRKNSFIPTPVSISIIGK